MSAQLAIIKALILFCPGGGIVENHIGLKQKHHFVRNLRVFFTKMLKTALPISPPSPC